MTSTAGIARRYLRSLIASGATPTERADHQPAARQNLWMRYLNSLLDVPPTRRRRPTFDPDTTTNARSTTPSSQRSHISTSCPGEPADGPPPTVPRPALSDREKEVLRLIARGFTHKQTAQHLGVSQATVDVHVERIRQKLGVGSSPRVVPRPGLSRREVEVLRLIARGFTHKQTAQHLGVSQATVDVDVERIRQKLGVSSHGLLVDVLEAAAAHGLVLI